ADGHAGGDLWIVRIRHSGTWSACRCGGVGRRSAGSDNEYRCRFYRWQAAGNDVPTDGAARPLPRTGQDGPALCLSEEIGRAPVQAGAAPALSERIRSDVTVPVTGKRLDA